jgi:hypothetical protein
VNCFKAKLPAEIELGVVCAGVGLKDDITVLMSLKR